MRILLIEDDKSLCESLRNDLVAVGYAVDVAHDGVSGEFLGSTENFDLVVLDLGLPELSGMEVLRRWRAANIDTPVLVLTARDAWHERIDGFKAGADDYLGKPFHTEELKLRLASLIKRRYGKAHKVLNAHGLTLDEDHQCVLLPDNRHEELTAVEFRLLRCFMMQPGKVLSKMQLGESIYESDLDRESNVIEVYVNRLRKKIGEAMITTRRGQGYVFGKTQETNP
jgi:two-component system, OmpR family, response regulator